MAVFYVSEEAKLLMPWINVVLQNKNVVYFKVVHLHVSYVLEINNEMRTEIIKHWYVFTLVYSSENISHYYYY